jgi:hypothetical protein
MIAPRASPSPKGASDRAAPRMAITEERRRRVRVVPDLPADDAPLYDVSDGMAVRLSGRHARAIGDVRVEDKVTARSAGQRMAMHGRGVRIVAKARVRALWGRGALPITLASPSSPTGP